MSALSAVAPNVERVAGVQIQVRLSRNGTGPWWELSQTSTNVLGSFRASGTRTCGREYAVQVRVRFADRNMIISGPQGITPLGNHPRPTPWFQIFSDISSETTRSAGVINLGIIDIASPTLAQRRELPPDPAFVLSRHAQIWTIYTRFLLALRSFGPDFAFPGRLDVKYPHNNYFIRGSEQSFTNPFNGQINIVRTGSAAGVRDQFNIPILFHEAFHIWAYANFGTPLDKAVGADEICLVHDFLLTGFDTHDVNTNLLMSRSGSRCSAFHEGFAEAAAQGMIQRIFGTAPGLLPLSRTRMREGTGILRGDRLFNIDRLERHDGGWQTILKTMMLDDLARYDFEPANGAGTAQIGPPIRVTAPNKAGDGLITFTCRERGLSLQNLLRLFMPAPRRGVPERLRTSDLTLANFLRRSVRIFPQKMGGQRIPAIMTAVRPSSRRNPSSFLCNSVDLPVFGGAE